MLSSGGIALVGAPDSDAGLKDGKQPPVQAMQVDITQDIVDELLESVRSGKSSQIIFGRTPVCVHSCCHASRHAWFDLGVGKGASWANHNNSN